MAETRRFPFDLIPLAAIGRSFFALALIGLGVEHFIFREFITGRAPAWPASVPGGTAWAFLTGVCFIAAGIAILIGKSVRAAALGAAILIFFWALLRHLPVVADASLFSSAWTRAGKALTFFGGTLAVAATAPRTQPSTFAAPLKRDRLDRVFITTGRVCLGLFLTITGVQHFIVTEFVASLIPGWFPGDAVAWTYFAGIALIAGGIGSLVQRTYHLATLLSGTMVFSWFWIVHLPRTMLSVSDGIAIFEALAVSGIAFVLASTRAQRRADTPAVSMA